MLTTLTEEEVMALNLAFINFAKMTAEELEVLVYCYDNAGREDEVWEHIATSTFEIEE